MGTPILSKMYLNQEKTNYEMVLFHPRIATKAAGGNFVILRVSEVGERFPITIADYDREKGTITIVVAAIGKSTKNLSLLNAGEEILDVVGPLGQKAENHHYPAPVIFIGGGVGIAAIYPQAKELKALGNYIISILGARTKSLLFWEEKFKAFSDEVIITTDDGSAGQKGTVVDALKEIIKARETSEVRAIGPLIMMKYVALATNGEQGLPKVKTMVSLNPIMVDGTGMCGGCRFITRSGETKFACVDGPDVDGHTVDFDNLLKRNARFSDVEKARFQTFDDQCRAVIKFTRDNPPNR